ncbi:alpha/beta hydrolase [Sphingomonas immobilis]|uniref:Alpha/beta fold hydrolase n=1 Tax=Sphingomonas immobilis TaxID=3063997 RepID=A0ABT8ZYT0_9SPHN|nr:alpha/beta fold hydrolase [Sphingomonas sp. CA1-15]MDO7841612.1 alpha/beta fold hydrolase [Sphingomonas sp. CA1-15]
MRRWRMRWWLPPLVLVALFGWGIWSVGGRLTAATNAAVPPLPAPAQVVRIASDPGITLAASYWPAPPKAPAVLLLHGNGGNRDNLTPLATWLSAQGYGVLAIDFRGHGASTPAIKSFGLTESADAHAALAWLKARHPGSATAAIGISLGGAAALLGPRGPLPVDALVLEGVYPDIRHAIYNRVASVGGKGMAAVIEPLLSVQALPRYGVWPSAISPVTAARQVRVPVLVVGGGADVFTPPAETRALFDALHRNGELTFLPGASHGMIVAANDTDPLRARIGAFLERYLRRKA